MSFLQKIKQIYKRSILWLRTRAHPRRIILGAGYTASSGWSLTDIDTLNILKESDWKIYFKQNSIDALLAEHVWEHMTASDGLQASRLCFKFLKKDGYLRIAVPDGFHPDLAYIESVKPNGTGVGAHDHKVLFTYKTLDALLQNAGFKLLLLEYFDEMGNFHQSDWDPARGFILRSARFDSRNRDGPLKYTSLIIDAIKV
jgi:predicted SAM-dependent methyltransferase